MNPLRMSLFAAGAAVAYYYYCHYYKTLGTGNPQHRMNEVLVQMLRSKVESQLSASSCKVEIIEEETYWKKCVEPIFLRHLQECPVVGFDCEWLSPSILLPHVKTIGKIALVQLATANGLCVLFRLSKLKVIPKKLQHILNSDKILKLGVGIDKDCEKMLNDFDVNVQGFVDLRHVAKEQHPTLQKLGLASLCSTYTNITLNKSWKLSAGDWEANTLTPKQIDYAANDAIAAINIGMAMTSHRLSQCSDLEASPNWGDFLLVTFQNSVDLPFKQKVKKKKNKKKKQSSNKDGGDSSKPDDDISLKENKENERSQNKKQTVRKEKFYDNARLLAPDEQPLCVCSTKKAEWYIEKGLGKKICDDPFSVQLNFQPSGRPNGPAGDYYLADKANICVACGKKDSFVRKYVVPHEYRKYFPEEFRDHHSHDVLLMCIDCHTQSNLLDFILRRELALECDAPIGTEEDIKMTENQALKEVKSASRALKSQRNIPSYGIPEDRIVILEKIVRKHFGISAEERIPEEILDQGSILDPRVSNPGYQPHGEKVVDHYIQHGLGIHSLEQRWRKHFIKTMKPKHLPSLWSVDHLQDKFSA